ncbi:hypothetical protein VCHA50P417_90022 [Vibrio chagasii]|nr:hypothetical protein VCHA35O142_60054 [Vibrio chagasii]CAH7077353.1 hypothetical protein VCHA36O163_80173 [Vibrio chagasii]CAH7100980.1 hypothetical protein VCHA31O71_90031 [Vibrio chagasii]CAH7412703.1 hypothetical protein VCHA50P417_90022 [Vibrio chagasii]CAH7414064.1 hypothetical protein VCHA49P382_70031 [Vibrio chagasii]
MRVASKSLSAIKSRLFAYWGGFKKVSKIWVLQGIVENRLSQNDLDTSVRLTLKNSIHIHVREWF